jgi:hypothetical protein
LPQLRHLKALWLNDVDAETIACLKGPNGFRYLRISGSRITDEGLKSFKELPQVEELVIDGPFDGACPRFTEVGLAHLRSLKHLRVLRLESVKISDEGLAEIAELGTLELLSLPDGISDAGALRLSKLRNLQQLCLNAVTLDDATVKELRWTLPHTTVEHWNPRRDP